jgi:hypothetical protein
MNNTIIDSLSLEDITFFLQFGKIENAPEGVADYLNILEKTRNMLNRFDKYPNDTIIVNFLVLQENLTPHKARTIIAETREFFWLDSRAVPIEAWANIYAEKIDKLGNLAMLLAKDPKDALAAVKIFEAAYNMRGGNKEEKEEIPYALLNPPKHIIYSIDVEDLGLPKANRNNVKALIESRRLELSEKEKNTVYREADILPFKIFPDESEDARKT